MDPIDGEHPGRALVECERGGKLKKALGADQIDLKGRTEGIASPFGSVSFGPGFADDGVVDGDDKRFVRGKGVHDGVADEREAR